VIEAQTTADYRSGLEAIPDELRERASFVAWKLEERDGGLTKIPYDAKIGRKASSTDSRTWATFREVLEALEAGGYDGAGYVFSSGDPYAGIDLDDCRDPQDGTIEPWAKKIIDALDGYTESSPSGRGVHIIVKGRAPNKRRGRLEAYSAERFFTLTGNVIEGSRRSMPERRDCLNALMARIFAEPKIETNGNAWHLADEEVIQRCRKARNAAKFASLFDEGDASAYGGDDSRADLALVSLLAFYSQDHAQIDRLFRRSALMREKWWRPDYRRRTIDHALAAGTETYTPPKAGENGHGGASSSSLPDSDYDGDDGDGVYSHHTHGGFGENKKPLPIKTVAELIEEAGTEVDWVVEDLLARGAVTEFSGKAKKSGKTTFWCHAIVAGAKGLEHAGVSTKEAKHLYLTEQGNNFVQALQDSGLAEHPDHVRIVQFKDVSARGWETLIRQAGAEAHKRGMDVLVVDTFAVFAGLKGSEENDSGSVADRMRTLRFVAQKYNLAVLLIRHAGKDGTPRGSSAFEAEADICVTLSRPEGRHAPTVRRLEGIGRYGEWERNVQLRDDGFVSLGDDNKIEFKKGLRFIKATLPEGGPEAGMKKQDLLDKREGEDKEISASTIDRALGWLVKQGAVGEKQLVNERGRPKVYWLAHESSGDEGVYFHQTPSEYGENKPGEPEPDDSAAWSGAY